MTILPVIDILNGDVVRGVAGRRDDYRPLTSRWSDSSRPIDVANGLQQAFGFQRFYLADLDGILWESPNLAMYRELKRKGFELLVDSGVRHAGDADEVLDHGAAAVIAGLETLPGPDSLDELILAFGSNQIIFSLDLQAGIPHLAPHSEWPQGNPLAIAQAALDVGVRRMIVLDLADVGTGTGGSTETLCKTLLQKNPLLELITGGGVRGPDDIRRWEQTGVTELLVASALHDGRLSPEFVRKFACPE